MEDTQEKARALLDDFLDPTRRSLATHELAALGPPAVAAVGSLLSGTARNRSGVPLRSSIEGIRCALVTAYHLGPSAAPLEPLLRAELSSDWTFLRCEAALAVGALGSVSDETAGALATLLDEISDAGMQAAAVLLELGMAEHTAVVGAISTSPRAQYNMANASKWVARR